MPADFDFPAGSALWVPVTVNERYRSSGRWLAAVAFPAWRAARVDPLVVLRGD